MVQSFKKHILSCAVLCALLAPAITYGMQEDDVCPICLAPLNNQQPICHVNCGGNHHFHRACINPWFIDHNSCPLCREDAVHIIDDPLPEPAAPHLAGAGLRARLAYIPTWLAHQWRRLTPQPVRDATALAIDLAAIVGCYRGTDLIAQSANQWQHGVEPVAQQNSTMQRARYAYLNALGIGGLAWVFTNILPNRFAGCTRLGAVILANNQMFLDNLKEDLASTVASNVGVATGLAALPCCKDAVIRMNRLTTIPFTGHGYNWFERGVQLGLSAVATFTVARHLVHASHRYF